MTKLTPDHPAVEAAMMEMTKGSGPLPRTMFRTQALNEALKVLEAALPHLAVATEDDRPWEPLDGRRVNVGDEVRQDHISLTTSGVVGRVNHSGNMYTAEGRFIGCIYHGTWYVRQPLQKLPTGDGDVIVSLKEDEVISTRDDSGKIRSFRRLTFDKNTHTWYGMGVRGLLCWVRPAEIENDTWKIEEK